MIVLSNFRSKRRADLSAVVQLRVIHHPCADTTGRVLLRLIPVQSTQLARQYASALVSKRRLAGDNAAPRSFDCRASDASTNASARPRVARGLAGARARSDFDGSRPGTSPAIRSAGPSAAAGRAPLQRDLSRCGSAQDPELVGVFFGARDVARATTGAKPACHIRQETALALFSRRRVWRRQRGQGAAIRRGGTTLAP